MRAVRGGQCIPDGWGNDLGYLEEFEKNNFRTFWDSLNEDDRKVFREILQAANQHRAAIKVSGCDLPYLVYLLILVLEEHKEIQRLKDMIGI
jgi:hypothetical protein